MLNYNLFFQQKKSFSTPSSIHIKKNLICTDEGVSQKAFTERKNYNFNTKAMILKS